jgi:hypothetical protein
VVRQQLRHLDRERRTVLEGTELTDMEEAEEEQRGSHKEEETVAGLPWSWERRKRGSHTVPCRTTMGHEVPLLCEGVLSVISTSPPRTV